jgi:hypothetical protein
VIVYYLYIVSVTIAPTKANPPLVIDPNTVLAFPVSLKFLKTVPRRDTKIIQSLGGVKHEKPTLRDPPQTGRESRSRLAMKDLFSVFGTKSLDQFELMIR